MIVIIRIMKRQLTLIGRMYMESLYNHIDRVKQPVVHFDTEASEVLLRYAFYILQYVHDDKTRFITNAGAGLRLVSQTSKETKHRSQTGANNGLKQKIYKPKLHDRDFLI